MFQLEPRDRVLANNGVSGPCPCSLYMYSPVAMRTPPLAPGLTALDLVRQTLDRYLGGMKGIGMEGYDRMTSRGFMDSYPSLLIAASETFSPDHAAIRAAVKHDYSAFAARSCPCVKCCTIHPLRR